jgi:hypothetical protein
MVKTSSNKTTVVKSSNKPNGKKRRREVQVVTCPTDFPQDPRANSASARPRERERKEQRFDNNSKKETFLDWNDTAREVRTLGSQAFMGKEKREYRQEEYTRLTGRKEKQQRVPLPIQRGIKKKAAQRLERQREEARQAGIILPVAKKEKPRVNKDQGPAPSIGYMKKGVFRVKGAN